MSAFVSPYLIPNNSKYSMAPTSLQHKHSTFLPTASQLSHLYHSVTLWFYVDFSGLLGISFRHQNGLLLRQKSEAYSKHGRTSKMEFFGKLINGFLLLNIFTESSLLDVWLGSKYVSEVICFKMHAETQLLNFYF